MAVAKKKARKKAAILTKAQRLARERAIIKELRGGELSYRRIAAKFGVSLPTVNSKARKAGIRRRPGVRGAMKAAPVPKAAAQPVRAKARRVVRAAGRPRKARAKQAPGAVRRVDRFQEQFRALVMSYYPDISLRAFDRLAKEIERAMS